MTLRVYQEECLRIMIHFFNQTFIVLVVIYHENLPQILFWTIVSWHLFQFRHGFHVQKVAILTDTYYRLILLAQRLFRRGRFRFWRQRGELEFARVVIQACKRHISALNEL